MRTARSHVTIFIFGFIQTIAAPVVAPQYTTPPANAASVTNSYTYTSYTTGTTYTVPSGVTYLSFQVQGGAGGNGGADGATGGTISSNVGYVSAQFNVNPGDVVQIFPGNQGANGANNANSSGGGAGGAGTVAASTFSINGSYSRSTQFSGGAGGNAGNGGAGSFSGAGGGGGAASVVAINYKVVLVAGGGGGGGGSGNTSSNAAVAWDGTFVSSGSFVGSAGGTPAGNADGGGGGGGGGGYMAGAGGTSIYRSSEYAGKGGSRGSNYIDSTGSAALNTTASPNGVGFINMTINPDNVNACATNVQTVDIYTIVKVTQLHQCTWAVPASVSVIDIFAVGGGGGGGGDSGGGGGGGAALSRTAIAVTPNSTLNLKVGYGGFGGSWGGKLSSQSGDSTTVTLASGSIFAALGGAAGAGAPGGAGGAGGTASNGGFAGGAGGAGGASGGNVGAAGKRGVSNYFYGTQNTYAGGGGGGGFTNSTVQTPAASVDGGGRGSYANTTSTNLPGEDGVANSGGGGGGGTATGSGDKLQGGSGGSGIILIRYATNAANSFPASLTSAVSYHWLPGDLQTLDSTRKGWIDSAAQSTSSLTITGTPTVESQGVTDSGYSVGSSKSLLTAQGSSTSSVTLLPGSLSNYTMFHISRYVRGQTTGRILTSTADWISGQYNLNNEGVAHHNVGWMTPTALPASEYKWLLSTDQTKLYRANGTDVTYDGNHSYVTGATGPTNLGINVRTGESSAWQMLDIIIFNRELSPAEIRTMEIYLGRIYGLTLSSTLQNSETDTAVTMDGNQYLRNQSLTANILNDTFTVEAWVNPGAACGTGGGVRCTLYSRYYTAILSVYDGYFGFILYGSATVWQWVDTTYKIPINEWHHIAFVKRGIANTNDGVDLYLDGQLVYTKKGSPYLTATTAVSYNAADVLRPTTDQWTYLGTHLDSYDRWRGSFDEVKVWKVARTASQIQSDMNSNDTSSAVLQEYWDFNSDVASSLANIPNLAMYSDGRSELKAYSDATITYTDVKTVTNASPYTVVTFPRTYITQYGGWKPSRTVNASVLTVGGGGGGGAAFNAYGGGAGGAGGGGAVDESVYSLTAGTVEVVKIGVGGIGGAAGASNSAGKSGETGTATTFRTTTMNPGGKGYAGKVSGSTRFELAGLSGVSGNGNRAGLNNWDASGGGGGAGGEGYVGVDIGSTGGCGGPGGAGKLSSISGSGVYYGAGGGGAGSYAASSAGGDVTPAGYNGSNVLLCDGNNGYGRGGTGAIGGSNSSGGDGTLVTYNAGLTAATSATAAKSGVTFGSGGGGGGYSNGSAVTDGGSGKQGVVIVRWITATKPAYTAPTNAYLNVGMTETFTTNVASDSATVGLTRTFKWESTTAGSGGTYSTIKQGTGASNASFSWVPTDTSTSGSGYLYRVVVTDSDTAGLYIQDTSTSVYAIINQPLSVSGTSRISKTINLTHNETFTITLGTPTYRASLSPVIPGITIDTSTAGYAVLKISDTATVGTWSETLTVTDSVSAVFNIPLTIKINAPPTLLNTSEIVLNGLILNLDAGNSRSIILGDNSSSAGVIWNDLSGNQKHAQTAATTSASSTFNSKTCTDPTYYSANGGYLSFDGVGDCYWSPYIGHQLERSFTVEAWFRLDGDSFGASRAIITQNILANSNVNFSMGDFVGDGKIYVGFYDGTWKKCATGYTPTKGVWNHLVGTYDGSNIKFYINGGSAWCTTAHTGGLGTSINTTGTWIARKWDAATYLNGSIATARVYNRALTQAEIQQNFDATKSRFDSTNLNQLKPTQKYGVLTLESFTATSGGDTKTITFANGNRQGVFWDTTSTPGQIKLSVGESLSVGTYYDTMTVTDNFGASTYLPLTFTVTKADTITVTSGPSLTTVYTGQAPTNGPVARVTGLVGRDTATVLTRYETGTVGSTCALGGTCVVGDTGPGGGVVFYVSDTPINAAPGVSDGGIYLEMYTTSLNVTNWSSDPTSVVGTSAALGTGAENTRLAYSQLGSNSSLMNTIVNGTYGGKSDWFVPSLNEATTMVSALRNLGLGSFGNQNLWTSTQSANTANAENVWSANPPVVGSLTKSGGFYVRPIRAFGGTTLTPADVETYTAQGTNINFSIGALSNYQAVNYETSTLKITQANQNKLSINLYGAVAGSPFLIQTSGGSGPGAVTETVTAGGSASGCTLSNHVLSNSSPSTQQVTCNIVVTKASSRNYKAETLTATVYFMLFVNNMPTDQVGSGSTIALNGATSVWVDPGATPTITGPTSGSFNQSGLITITGSGFSLGPIIVKFNRNQVVSGITAGSDTSMTITIPAGALSGFFSVTNANGIAVSPNSINILPPANM